MGDKGFHKNIREVEARRETVREFCAGCLNLNERTVECRVLKEPYPLWGKGECWGRVESRKQLLQTLDEMEQYNEAKNSTVIYRIARERERVSSISDEDIREVYHEEVHKPLLKPPQGEGQDRTHKLFPKSRMKDNRYKPPWEGF